MDRLNPLDALFVGAESQRLDRDHPLREYWVAEGLAGGRWALISKVHHCMVDAVSCASPGLDVLARGIEAGVSELLKAARPTRAATRQAT